MYILLDLAISAFNWGVSRAWAGFKIIGATERHRRRSVVIVARLLIRRNVVCRRDIVIETGLTSNVGSAIKYRANKARSSLCRKV